MDVFVFLTVVISVAMATWSATNLAAHKKYSRLFEKLIERDKELTRRSKEFGDRLADLQRRVDER